jgi:NAD(P)-dependent dehydrogenase (short-subunit alcohol dehydrogenase family)
MAPWSLISPASRGIGFALARRVLQTTNAPVVATARKDLDKTKEELLEGLGVDENRLRVLKLDVLGMFVSVVVELSGGTSGVARFISYFK